MTAQRLQTVIIVLLLVGCISLGVSLYYRNNDVVGLHNAIGTLSDEVRQTAKNRNGAAAPDNPSETDLATARMELDACGQTPSKTNLTQSERMDAVLPYLEVGKKFASLTDEGYELVDACVDDSADPRILFLAVKHLPNFAGDVAFGQMSEADPKAATIATMRDNLNLVNDVSPSVCKITGTGAVPESQFLVRCENADTAVNHGVVLDFQKRQGTDVYRCSTAESGSCETLDADTYEANKAYFDDDALKNMAN